MDERLRRLKELFWLRREWTIAEASEASTLVLRGDDEDVMRLYSIFSVMEWKPTTPLGPELRVPKFFQFNIAALHRGVKHVIMRHCSVLIKQLRESNADTRKARIQSFNDHPTTKFMMEAPDGDAT